MADLQLPANLSSTLLGGLTPEEFLSGHWQKKPLLIRGAFPDFPNPLTPDELAGLACEDNVESRLVLESGPHGAWEVRYGPFEPVEFARLGEAGWTLLVQDVDKHVSSTAALLEPFAFVPYWRTDDLMVSYAPPGGSVGAHVDQYDVCLLQGYGVRRWMVSGQPLVQPRYLPDLDIRILEHFAPDHEWLLRPGDMLYLPPGFAHHGVAVEACMTYSIGFRTPSLREIAAAMADEIIARVDPEQRLEDPRVVPVTDPGQVEPETLRQVRAFVRDAFRITDWDIDGQFAALVTEPKTHLVAESSAERLSPDQFRERYRRCGALRRNPATRVACLQGAEGQLRLFIDGEEHPLDPTASALAALFAAQTVLPYPLVQNLLHAGHPLEFLRGLYLSGHLLCEDDRNTPEGR